MKDDSLLYFDSPVTFFEFLEELGINEKWRVQEGLMNERGKRIEQKSYTLYLRQLFTERGFFRRLVSLAEVVSWLDNLVLISRFLRKLQYTISHSDFIQIEISIEYMIHMSKKMRIDYVFKYRHNILLVELRTVNSFSKVRSTWNKKFQELMIYKELMSYYLHDYNFRVYALIPLYEYVKGRVVQKHYQNNENQLDYLCKYTQKYLILD